MEDYLILEPGSPVARACAQAAVLMGLSPPVGLHTHAMKNGLEGERRWPSLAALAMAVCLLVDAARHVLWRYPAAGAPAPPGGFYFPDDAFFIRHGTAVISNQEGNDSNDTIVEIAFPSGRVRWRYGHPRVAGSRPGYLYQPDDAYLLRDGRVVVADAKNCRILLIGPHGTTQIGTTRHCVHDPPRSLGSPNGDTPLANGNLLISEVRGSWIDEVTPKGRLVWSVHLPIAYPSDPQQLGPDLYLVADYARPGGVVEFTREGRIVWLYRPRGGAAMLDHPSLADGTTPTHPQTG